MNNIHEPTSERRAAIAVIIEDSRYLVIKRSQQVRAAGMFCFPGGGIEPGESEVDALIREIHEELGVHITVQNKVYQSTNDRGVELNWYRVSILPNQEITLDQLEVSSYCWLTRDEIYKLDNVLPSNLEFLNRFDK